MLMGNGQYDDLLGENRDEDCVRERRADHERTQLAASDFVVD